MYSLALFLIATLNVATANYSFLTSLPHKDNSSDTKSGNKEKYISQTEFELSWVDAAFYCNANRLKLARISSANDLQVLSKRLSSYIVIANTEIIFDGSSLPERFEASPCSVIDAVTGFTRNISCTEGSFMFICETFDGGEQAEMNRVDVSQRFTSHALKKINKVYFNVYGNDNSGEILKKYFILSPRIRMTIAEAAMFCQSMDMTLSTPQNQKEYDHLRENLKTAQVEWQNLIAGIYRSENDETAWMSRGAEVNFTIAFAPGQPDESNENCLVFKRPGVGMKIAPCDAKHQVLCERETETIVNSNGLQTEASKYIKPIAKLSFDTMRGFVTKRLYANHNFLTSSWFGARRICKAFGMDLYAPEEAHEYAGILRELEDISIDNFFVGVTNLLTPPEHWHATHNGKILRYKISLIPEPHKMSKHCVMMQLIDGELVGRSVSCTRGTANFICQKRSIAKERPERIRKMNRRNTFEFWKVSVPDRPLVEASSSEPTDYTPNSSDCDNTQDIFDANGTYLKTACQFSYRMTYDEACTDLEMNKFIICSPDVQAQVLAFASNISERVGTTNFWANGWEDVEGDWFTSDGKRKERMMPGIKGLEHSKLSNQFRCRQDCLSLNNNQIWHEICEEKLYGICEFKKPGMIDEVSTEEESLEEDGELVTRGSGKECPSFRNCYNFDKILSIKR